MQCDRRLRADAGHSIEPAVIDPYLPHGATVFGAHTDPDDERSNPSSTLVAEESDSFSYPTPLEVREWRIMLWEHVRQRRNMRRTFKAWRLVGGMNRYFPDLVLAAVQGLGDAWDPAGAANLDAAVADKLHESNLRCKLFLAWKTLHVMLSEAQEQLKQAQEQEQEQPKKQEAEQKQLGVRTNFGTTEMECE